MKIYLVKKRKSYKQKIKEKLKLSRKGPKKEKKKKVDSEMKINIGEQKDNGLMKRKELNVVIDHGNEATPTKAAIQQLVAREVKKDVTNVEIVNIFSEFGKAKSKSTVYVWDEKKVDDLSKVVKEKDEKKEETKPEAKPEAKEKVNEVPESKEDKSDSKETKTEVKEESKEEKKPDSDRKSENK